MEKRYFPSEYGKQNWSLLSLNHNSLKTALLSQEHNDSPSSKSSYKFAASSSVKSQQQSNNGGTSELFGTDWPYSEPGITSYLQGSSMRTQLHR